MCNQNSNYAIESYKLASSIFPFIFLFDQFINLNSVIRILITHLMRNFSNFFQLYFISVLDSSSLKGESCWDECTNILQALCYYIWELIKDIEDLIKYFPNINEAQFLDKRYMFRVLSIFSLTNSTVWFKVLWKLFNGDNRR